MFALAPIGCAVLASFVAGAALLGVLPPAAAAAGAAALAVAAALLPRSAAISAAPVAVEVAAPAEPEPEPAEDPLPALRAGLARLRDGALTARVGGEADAALAATQAALDEAIAIGDLLALGDLSVTGSRAHKGQYDGLLRALDGVSEGLRRLIATVMAAADDVGAQASALAQGADALDDGVSAQVAALEGARAASAGMEAAVAAVERSATAGASSATRAATVAQEGLDGAQAAAEAIARVEATSRSIRDVLSVTASIAQQTKLLGVNASVEAARAGDAGRGFAVVAREIQSLAERAADSAREINAQIAESDAALALCGKQTRACAEMLRRIGEEVAGVGAATADIRAACARQTGVLADALASIAAAEAAGRRGAEVAHATSATAAALDTATHGLRDILSGVLLDDAAMALAVQERAAALSRLFEEGVRAGRISMADLFSTDYRPIPGTNPPQFMPPFVAFTDTVAPGVIEGAFDLGDHVVFSAPVNRDGFLPTHNRKFSQPQGPDPVKNAATSRNRRFFDDRVGLAAGRSTAPVLVQAYRRDMGGGSFVTMKDISAPIIVNGRHWGGLRIGYRPTSLRLADAADRAA